MVFRCRIAAGHPPTPADCKAIAENYGLWEDSGFGVGYTLLRGQFSYFTRCNVYSEDSTSRASFVDTPFMRAGQLPSLGAKIVPTSVAPLCRWTAVGSAGRAAGRTYLVGIAQSTLLLPDDLENLGKGSAITIATQMNAMVSLFASVGAPLVLVSRRRSLGYTGTPLVLDITHGAVATGLMASQRRRTRSG